MFPLNFEEFLQAINKRLFDFYKNLDSKKIVEELIHKDLLEIFYLYLAI
jgi:hypothetical protein